MLLAAFVRSSAARNLRGLAGNDRITFARSWKELASVACSNVPDVLIIDPTAEGSVNCQAVIRLMQSFPATPVVACVCLSGQNLKAVVNLSQYGLAEAVLDLPNERTADLRKALDRVRRHVHAREFLGWLERPLATLPVSVRYSVLDAFLRPHRYNTAADLAIEAEVTPKSLRRMFREAELGSPKHFVIVAKLLSSYTYLREAGLGVSAVAAKVGFPCTPSYTAYCDKVFSFPPSALRQQPSREEIVRALLDWMYKAIHRRQRYQD